jgi:DNA-binding SARP family transcriptional activator
MSLTLRLLGRPTAERTDTSTYHFRSRKSWALLAYLLLSERPPTRSQLATLLFADADDPLRALRWSLAEIRRCLGPDGSVDGDPVRLALAPDVVVDVDVLVHGSAADAVRLPGLGSDLLDGTVIRGAAGFESWLLSEQRRFAAAAESVLHEAALVALSQGATTRARGLAVRAAAMSPLDENHQALLIRLYRQDGDEDAAEKQFAAYARMCRLELGSAPGAAVLAALHEPTREESEVADAASIEAVVEAGTAAVAAGAGDAGIASLRTAARLADTAGNTALRVRSRLVLAEALVHSFGGLDEAGLAALHEADQIALDAGDDDAAARARAELGYVDFLRARYDRAERWLADALARSAGSPSLQAKATTYLGSVESDRADYGRALALLDEATVLSRTAGEPRREAFGRSMLGRVHLLRGDLESALDELEESVRLAQADHWLAFLPWPQALHGEVLLALGRPQDAAETAGQAFARACQVGDPCWEGISARGVAMVTEAAGDAAGGFDVLADARARCNRLADPYVWLDVYILDALCTLGRRHAHPSTATWVDEMRTLASRHGMRELVVRAMLHGAALGDEGDAAAAGLLAADIDNPALQRLADAPHR